MNQHGKSILMASAALAAASFAVQVQAQSAGVQQLDEVVVTAQRTQTSLQKTPISVTAFNAQALAQRGASSLLDLSTYTPNLSIASRSGQGANSASFSIRGMGVNAGDSSAAVGIYVDEVYFPSSNGNLLGLLDTDRVEVLRGPQGTLFGRNTIGGAVQYVSVKPGKALEGFIEGTLGDLDRRQAQGAVNVPLGDQLAARLSLSTNRQGGYVTDDFNGVKRGRVDTNLGRLQVRWTPTEKLTVDLKAEASRQRTNGRPQAISLVNPKAQFAGLAFLFGETRPLTDAYLSTRKYHVAGYNAPDYFRSDLKSYVANVGYQLTDTIRVKSISAYAKNDNRSAADFDMTPLSILAVNNGKNLDELFTEELQLVGHSFGDRLDWTGGLYYYDGSNKQIGRQIQIGRFNLVKRDDTDSQAQSQAAYLNLTYHLTPQLSVAAGLRYSHEEVTGKNLTVGTSRSATFNDTSPNIGVNFQATPDLLLYAKASKGFRAGGFTIDSALPGGALVFSPETAWTYEAGARMEFMNRRLRVNPTIFFTDWKNIQFNFLVPTPTTIATATQNAGDAHIKGAELEVQWAATERLLVTASASYLDAHYTRIAPAGFIRTTYPFGFLASLPAPPTFQPAPGSVVQSANLSLSDPLQQSPKYKFSLGGRYTQPLTDTFEMVGSLDYGWTDKQTAAVTESDARLIPAYGLLNGRLAFRPKDARWSVALYGTNLLNKYYLIGGSGFGQGFTVGNNGDDPGRPREYGVTVRANFSQPERAVEPPRP